MMETVYMPDLNTQMHAFSCMHRRETCILTLINHWIQHKPA